LTKYNNGLTIKGNKVMNKGDLYMARKKYTNEEIEQYRKENKSAFYVNPHDSNIMVPKKHGRGYSPNFANPIFWIASILLIALIIILIIILV
jgi:uncharacterized membrane protein